MNRKTVTMDFESLESNKEEDDSFFDTRDRLSSAVPLDLGSGSDDEDEFFEANRMSFVSASFKRIYSIEPISNPPSQPIILPSYDMWITEPGDVSERRKRLLHDMGLASNKDLLRLATSKNVRAISIKLGPDTTRVVSPAPKPEPSDPAVVDSSSAVEEQSNKNPPPSPIRAIVLVRSRSDGDIDLFSSRTKQRKEEIIGPVSKGKLIRTLSGQLVPSKGPCQYSCAVRLFPESEKKAQLTAENGVMTDDGFGSFFLIKNLDTGKDFIVKEFNEQGMWNKLNDVQTGKQLTMEEFEKSVGYSPVVKELMRRVSRNMAGKDAGKSKDAQKSTKKGNALLKNIKGVATSVSGLLVVEKEDQENSGHDHQNQKASKGTSQWVDAHQHGKSYKEFTALHLSQEIQAHEGSIWTMRFSENSRYLASGGEDTVVHVWEVQECEVKTVDNSTTDANNHAAVVELSTMPPEMRKKGKKSGKGNSIPEYVKVPETVVTLSDKPYCSFQGHKDEVLDLAWSKTQLLLSSSMDKTVRLWDLGTKSCLKTFAHKDYVTCIQFNPVAEDYFISGSLDGKVRIWSIPDHRVADWTDVHEMVTAASYNPDGQGAVIGSQQGSCRMYTIDVCKHRFETRTSYGSTEEEKSQSKFPAFQSQAKKIPGFQSPAPPGKVTGFQFTPWDPSQVLVTSADSRIGIYNGPDLIQKYRGFRNTSSQISATFSPDGKHIISASEDSQIFIWKVEESKNSSSGKRKTTVTIQAHEHFHCKDVSTAITWPGSSKFEPPLVDLHSKKNTKRPSAPPPPNPATGEETDNSNSNSSLPPLPNKKTGTSEENVTRPDDDSAQSTAAVDPPGTGSHDPVSDSETTSSGSATQTQSSENVNSNSSHGMIQATAWGMVIVAATLEGEIRVYQNFGLPLKVARQAYLF